MMDLSYRTLDPALRVLAADAHPAEAVSRLYTIADLLEATDKAITCTWAAMVRAGRANGLQDILTDYDFLMRSRDLRKVADAWQDELDEKAD